MQLRIDLRARPVAVRIAAAIVGRVANTSPTHRTGIARGAGTLAIGVTAGVVCGVAHGALAHGRGHRGVAVSAQLGLMPGDLGQRTTVGQFG